VDAEAPAVTGAGEDDVALGMECVVLIIVLLTAARATAVFVVL